MTDTPLPLVAFDWSHKAIHVTFDGDAVTRMSDIDALLDSLRSPHRIVAENTFESWRPEARARLIERMRADGHDFVVYRPLRTARTRTRLYEQAVAAEDTAGMARWAKTNKSDEVDALLIHHIATQTRQHLYPPVPVDQDRAAAVARTNHAYALARVAGQKDAMAGQVAALLGPYKDKRGKAPETSTLTPVQRLMYGNGKQYTTSLLAAAYTAAQNATDREHFTRLLGLHASAHPTLLRSETHHHSIRHAIPRLSAYLHAAWIAGDPVDERLQEALTAAGDDELAIAHAYHKAALRIIRRELRGLFQVLKSAGVGAPA